MFILHVIIQRNLQPGSVLLQNTRGNIEFIDSSVQLLLAVRFMET